MKLLIYKNKCSFAFLFIFFETELFESIKFQLWQLWHLTLSKPLLKSTSNLEITFILPNEGPSLVSTPISLSQHLQIILVSSILFLFHPLNSKPCGHTLRSPTYDYIYQ